MSNQSGLSMNQWMNRALKAEAECDLLVQSCTRLGNEREQFLAERDRLQEQSNAQARIGIAQEQTILDLEADRDRLAGELAKLEAERGDFGREVEQAAHSVIDGLEADLAAARAALEFYADVQTYISGRMSEGGYFYKHHIEWDFGERARAALSAVR